MKLTIGFSPCPNDTFIFDALVNGKINTGDLQFEPVLEDVETLNQWALEGKLDITKLSFPAFFKSLQHYVLLNSGSALGKGVGPILISTVEPDFSNTPAGKGMTDDAVNNKEIILPGENTTANLLFSFAYPKAERKLYQRFDKIEDRVIASAGQCLGVIIHESRFTYQQKGLHKLMDLGEYWETKMNVPIPLGGIAIKRSIDKAISIQVDNLIRDSLEYSFSNYPVITEYVKQHSQAMSEEVMRKHIDLYVNEYSLALGEEGKHAITTLQRIFLKGEHSNDNLFL